jgi:hypothetical protein
MALLWVKLTLSRWRGLLRQHQVKHTVGVLGLGLPRIHGAVQSENGATAPWFLLAQFRLHFGRRPRRFRRSETDRASDPVLVPIPSTDNAFGAVAECSLDVVALARLRLVKHRAVTLASAPAMHAPHRGVLT